MIISKIRYIHDYLIFGNNQRLMFRVSIPFQVDSLEFPGQKHKWLLTQLLLKGKNKAHETLLDDLAKSLYLLGKHKNTIYYCL